jgi:hypothetical protein
MAFKLIETSHFVVHSHRGGGLSLRCLADNREVFFQPGDDAAAMRDTVDACDELPEARRDDIFDSIASEYFAA